MLNVCIVKCYHVKLQEQTADGKYNRPSKYMKHINSCIQIIKKNTAIGSGTKKRLAIMKIFGRQFFLKKYTMTIRNITASED
jgi:hypothetical protein